MKLSRTACDALPAPSVATRVARYFPGFSDFGATGARTYVVTALGRSGLEGLPSAAVVGTPP